MKKADSIKDTLRNEYVSSDFPRGFSRGKYAAKAATSHIVVLESDVASAFPNSAAVNEALRTILMAVKFLELGLHAQRDGAWCTWCHPIHVIGAGVVGFVKQVVNVQGKTKRGMGLPVRHGSDGRITW
jgi:hypothetical protein